MKEAMEMDTGKANEVLEELVKTYKKIPAFEVNPIELRKKGKWVKLSRLKWNLQHQRKTDNKRKLRIKAKMEAVGGFDSAFPILVDQDMQIIDGQHRCLAASDLGYEEVYVKTIDLNSGSEEVAAQYFSMISEDVVPPNKIDMWNARYHGNDPVAWILYQLNVDTSSRLFEKIRLKNMPTARTFTISDVLFMLNVAVRGFPYRYGRKEEESFYNEMTSHSYENIRACVNEYCDFLFQVIGSDRDSKAYGHFYNLSGGKALARFWLLAKAQYLGQAHVVGARLARYFKWSQAFDDCDEDTKLMILIKRFNYRLTRNKMYFPVEE